MSATVDSKSLAEVSFIISMMPQSMRSKINHNFIQLVEENKDKSYEPNFDLSEPLEKQNLSEETRAILALMYRDYLCSDVERKSLQEKEQIRGFNTEHENIKAEPKAMPDEVSVVEYKKENVFKQIYNRIKRIITRSN